MERCCKLLKVKKLLLAAVAAGFLSLSLPVQTFADSVSDIKQQEEATSKQGEQINKEIQLALSDVNAKYQAIAKLKQDISKAENKIEKTELSINETKDSIAKRKVMIGERMQSIQTGSAGQRRLQALLDAESISDFLTRMYSVSVLQSAEREKIDSLYADETKLDELNATLKNTKDSLEQNEVALSSEAAIMDEKVSELKEKLADNQTVLTQLANSRQAEEARIARELQEQARKEKEEQEAKAAAEAKQAEQAAATEESTSSSTVSSETTTSSSNSTADSSSNNSQPQTDNSSSTPAPSVPSTGGNTLTAVATGYSYTQPGLSFYTATGIDLRTNPQVIAVDPSVIPLGSIVEVPGYGVAVAGDTGGDIKGNRIDLHFKTVDECKNWGRRSVTIRIL